VGFTGGASPPAAVDAVLLLATAVVANLPEVVAVGMEGVGMEGLEVGEAALLGKADFAAAAAAAAAALFFSSALASAEEAEAAFSLEASYLARALLNSIENS
jgi:hypothetical protein